MSHLSGWRTRPPSQTLDEWHKFRHALAALPQENKNVRVAIAVADAKIERLKADK
jgi:hypothetical protein